MPTYKTFARLMRVRPWAYLADITMISLFYMFIGLNGLVIRGFFDYLTDESAAA